MKIQSANQTKKLLLSSLLLISYLAISKLSLAVAPVSGPVNLTQIPLANSSTSLVKPNVMFVLDDSGSMGADYLPDWAGDNPYRSTEYLFKNPDFNGLAYNPAISYQKPAMFNADGSKDNTTYPNQIGTSNATGGSTNYALPNWRKVKKDGYGILDSGTTDFLNNAFYYTTIPGEYCKERDLKDCTAASAPSTTYPFRAALRWCNTSANAAAASAPNDGSCQAINDGDVPAPNNVHVYPRYPSPRNATVTVSGSGNTTVTGITVGGQQIMSSSTGTWSNANDVASTIAQRINDCTYSLTGSCVISGYKAAASGNTVTILASVALLSVGTSSVPTISSTGAMSISSTAFLKNDVPGENVVTYISAATTGFKYPGSTTKDIDRVDCAASTCTYTEEIINYANWHAYYRTRIQAMKTAASRAFSAIDSRYRVGLTNIRNSDFSATNSSSSSTSFLAPNTFELAHKNNWYTKLFGTSVGGGTPLRSALSKLGRFYANKLSSQTDPMQYSCQQNFTILSTDGYWNTDSSGDVKDLSGTKIGNLDGPSSTPNATYKRPVWEGPVETKATLADAARYYYQTDLRTPDLSNCVSGSTGETLCSTFSAPDTDDSYNNVYTNPKDPLTIQHMVTFTMGLGVDGTITYSPSYDDDKTGDYSRLKSGVSPVVNWSIPAENTQTAVDDLWHAAVNGNGIYFSAKNPNDIIEGLVRGLSSIAAKLGSGAAAATSTLNPVAGDNFAYVASYTTNSWIGNLEARPINVSTGVVSESATWCVEDVVQGTCSTPLVVDSTGGSKVYNCVTGGVTVEMPVACAGRMNAPGVVAATTDSRKIWTKGSGENTLNNFSATSGALNAADFNATKLATLTQWSANPHSGAPFTTVQQTAAVSNIVAYLRGQTGYEDIPSNLTGSGATEVDNRLFRARDAVLGDAIESQPAFIGKPTFSYLDTGYSAFKTANASRAGTVYMGANDGMMHAFNASTGDERWAYVPSMVIPNMFTLADSNYSSQHLYFANGSPVISDIKDGSTWKTILVAGLNGGGRGYYALDITDPTLPKLLWEFTPANDSDLGYTFGNPVITKKSNGDWVVLVTSGYNNIPDASPRVKFPRINTGDGKGYLYVLNATTGAKISKISTGVGTTAIPSGLAQIASFADDAEKDNTATFTYGGDLLGNVWRFDINTATVVKFAELKDPSGITQPIMTKPELGKLVTNGQLHRVIFIGTGKYLESSDLSDTQTQTLYAIKDDDTLTSSVTPALVNPRSFTSGANRMVQQTLTTAGSKRNGTNNSVNFNNDRGWFIDFAPPGGERNNVSSRLVLGTLIVPTTIPSSTACNPGGTSWLNYFNYKNGGPVKSNNQVSTKQNAPIVGINVFYINDPVTGKPKPIVSAVTADHPTPEVIPDVPFSNVGVGFQKKRAVWRELTQ